MNDVHPALLPAGLRDLLPPDAAIEAASVEALMSVFASHGYERVKPPLLEFEESLLSDAGAPVADQIFRLMDPDTHRMMGLRADMTPQVARIAATRLAHQPRPLRLCYAGQCIRVHASQLAPERQVAQAGIELIGHDSPAADAEIVGLGAAALAAVGLDRLSFDLTMPPLIAALLAEIPDPSRETVARALDRKDAAAVAAHGGRLAGTLTTLLLAAGPAERVLAALRDVDLPEAAREPAERLAQTVAAILAAGPAPKLTLDPVEFRGFRYHTGVCVTIYAAGFAEELGRGGRYVAGESEPATGLTLFPDAVLRAAPKRPAKARVYVPDGADPAGAAALRKQGFATVRALDPHADPRGEARRLACGYVLSGGGLVAIDG